MADISFLHVWICLPSGPAVRKGLVPSDLHRTLDQCIGRMCQSLSELVEAHVNTHSTFVRLNVGLMSIYLPQFDGKDRIRICRYKGNQSVRSLDHG